MREGEKVKVLDLPHDQERNDGIYEEFWKVRDPYVFAKKILHQSQARKYFRSEGLYKDLYCKTNESVKIDFRSKDKIRKKIKKDAKNMNIFQVFAQKDMKQIKPKLMCKFVRSIIEQRKNNLSIEESIQVWMHCSDSLDQMRQNQQYYKKILQQKYFDHSEHQIDQDIKRSKALVKDEGHLLAMKRIFIAYARRNACIGYCQGLNYIVAKFLQFNISEEESFWLLVQLLENILPLDYYPSMMMGVVCDQKIFEQILRVENEKVYKKFISFEANVLNILLTQWIVCLFTQALDDSLLLIVFNHLFTKGSITIFKVCLVLINYCKNEILKSEGLEVVKEIENKVKEWKDTKKFKAKLEKIYINEKGINFMREFYKQICMIQLKQKSQNKRYNQTRQVDLTKIDCNQDYPTCKHILELENTKDNNQPPEYFIFKSERNFSLDWNYFKQSKVGDKRNVGINEDENIMQTKHIHICVKKQSNNNSLAKADEKQSQLTQMQQQAQINQQEQQQQQQIQQLQQNIEQKEQILEIKDIQKQKQEEEQEEEEEEKVQLEIDQVQEIDSPKMNNQGVNKLKQTQSCIIQDSSNSEHYASVNLQDDMRYSSDSNVEPSLFFKREELDNSNSFRFFSDITKQRNKFNYLINPNKNVNNFNQSEISKVIKEVQEDI